MEPGVETWTKLDYLHFSKLVEHVKVQCPSKWLEKSYIERQCMIPYIEGRCSTFLKIHPHIVAI